MGTLAAGAGIVPAAGGVAGTLEWAPGGAEDDGADEDGDEAGAEGAAGAATGAATGASGMILSSKYEKAARCRPLADR